MHKIILSILVSLYFNFQIQSQTPYTTDKYSFTKQSNVVYGTAINFAGNIDTLKMDIYKPINDSNCRRPIAIVVHGGAFVAGSKEDSDTRLLSEQFVKKGWIVANINYRLGNHKTTNFNMYALCNSGLASPCIYVYDTAEVYRALFRAMQDTKGAIRFMKNRSSADSSDPNNVYLTGTSAGAITVLHTAFTDSTIEKNSSCFGIDSVLIPDSDMFSAACIPNNIKYSRPDLGSIEGDLHLYQHDASVKGVGSFYGAILDKSILTQYKDTPCVYLFHQGSDVVVDYKYSKLMSRLSWECFDQSNLCQSITKYPYAYGGESIRILFDSLKTNAPAYQVDIVYNRTYLGNCFSNGHSIDNPTSRTQNMITLFADKVLLTNNPNTNCKPSTLNPLTIISNFTIYPNPASHDITLSLKNKDNTNNYSIIDMWGNTVTSGHIKGENINIDLSNLKSGTYFITVNHISFKKLIILND